MTCENKVLSRFAQSCIAVYVGCHELCALHLNKVFSELCLTDDLIRTGQIEDDLRSALNVVNRRALCDPEVLADLNCKVKSVAVKHSPAEADAFISHDDTVILVRSEMS